MTDITPRVRLNRLKKLEHMLLNYDEIFPKVEFGIGVWGKKIDCGTSACALGSAGLYPPFRRKGLKTVIGCFMESCVNYKRYKDLLAGSWFFGIPLYESDWLFWPDKYHTKEGRQYITSNSRKRYITPQRVAERVNKLIKKYEKEMS